MQERTEKPSALRLKKAKEKKEIAKSSELAAAITLLCALLLIKIFSSFFYQKISLLFDVGFENKLIPILAPFFLLFALIFASILLSHFLQTGWIWGKGKGAKKNRSGVLFCFLKLGSLSIITYIWMHHTFSNFSTDLEAPTLFENLFLFLLTLFSFYVLLGLIDLFYQKWRHYKKLYMNRQEQKEEMREMEGDRALKMQMRRR